jgi:predicted Fe-Mo cluster-binding NifX family protein
MKIAVTSQNFRTVTAHAGKTRRFLIYELVPPGAPQEVERLDLPQELSFHEFRGTHHPVDGVTALITGGAGDGFRARLAQRCIEVVVTGETDPVQAVRDYIAGVVKPAPAHPHHC